MYFTRLDTGFRGWFQVVRGNGTLRTDIAGSDFTALIVDANDTTSSLMTVTQSVQKQGLYRFDIPSSFLVTNGSGEYGVSVELNTSSPPKVTTAFSEILKVSQDDFDSLSGSIITDVDAIVTGVWTAVTSTFNTSGTMGWLQNKTYDNSVDILDDTLLLISGVNTILGQTTDIQNIVASGSVNISLNSINTFVSSVWQANDLTFNTSGTMGYLQNLIDDIRTESGQNTTTLNFISSSVVDISSSITNIENGGTVVSATLTPAGVTQVVSGVWSAASGTYNASGTMGFLQNQIGATQISASVTIDNQAVADAVWNTLTSSMTVSGSAGAVLFTQTNALATKICEIYQILGLELGSPLTVSDVQRTVAAITQSISCVNDVVTVTRTS